MLVAPRSPEPFQPIGEGDARFELVAALETALDVRNEAGEGQAFPVFLFGPRWLFLFRSGIDGDHSRISERSHFISPRGIDGRRDEDGLRRRMRDRAKERGERLQLPLGRSEDENGDPRRQGSVGQSVGSEIVGGQTRIDDDQPVILEIAHFTSAARRHEPCQQTIGNGVGDGRRAGQKNTIGTHECLLFSRSTDCGEWTDVLSYVHADYAAIHPGGTEKENARREGRPPRIRARGSSARVIDAADRRSGDQPCGRPSGVVWNREDEDGSFAHAFLRRDEVGAAVTWSKCGGTSEAARLQTMSRRSRLTGRRIQAELSPLPLPRPCSGPAFCSWSGSVLPVRRPGASAPCASRRSGRRPR